MRRRTAGLLIAGVMVGSMAMARQGEPQVEKGQLTGGDHLIHPFSIVRLAPGAFAQAPGAVRDELVRRGCLIPQTFRAQQAENVISGKFRNGSNGDWAALCSKAGSSSVLVFWNGSAQGVQELSAQKDTDYVQALTSGVVYGYSRRITAASPERIRKAKQNRRLEPFDHDGIDDAFVEKGSVIHYFREGHWEELQGGEVKK